MLMNDILLSSVNSFGFVITDSNCKWYFDIVNIVKFRRMPNFAAFWVFKCQFSWVPSLPHAEFFRVSSFFDCWGPNLPRAEFCRMPDFAMWQRVEGCLQWNLNRMSLITFTTIETLWDSRASVMLEIKRAFFWMVHTLCFYMGLNLNLKRL